MRLQHAYYEHDRKQQSGLAHETNVPLFAGNSVFKRKRDKNVSLFPLLPIRA
jgi:hypothetical protein